VPCLAVIFVSVSWNSFIANLFFSLRCRYYHGVAVIPELSLKISPTLTSRCN
jgi:hypothetical protein